MPSPPPTLTYASPTTPSSRSRIALALISLAISSPLLSFLLGDYGFTSIAGMGRGPVGPPISYHRIGYFRFLDFNTCSTPTSLDLTIHWPNLVLTLILATAIPSIIYLILRHHIFRHSTLNPATPPQNL